MPRTRNTGTRAILSPAALHILITLTEGPLHGHAVKEEIEARTDGELVLGPGTLYEAIHRMLRDGWLEEAVEATAADPDGRRKHYRITAPGRRAMEAELVRLDRLVGDARARRLIPKTREA